MSALTIIQTVCKRLGLNSPNTINSTDQQIIQMAALLNEEGQELAQRYAWQVLIKEATFTTVATETQTTLPSGFKYILNDTIWNRSLDEPLSGPQSPQSWQALKAQSFTGPYHQYRIQGNAIKFIPVPAAGMDCYYEYVSKNWCYSTTNVDNDAFTADDDAPYLDEQLLILGTIWRWKQAKGLEYAEDFAKYERRVVDAIARDGGREKLSLDGSSGGIFPAVTIPSGNWNQ